MKDFFDAPNSVLEELQQILHDVFDLVLPWNPIPEPGDEDDDPSPPSDIPTPKL